MAIAAPAGPILNPERKRISSATFKAVEITRKISGVTEWGIFARIDNGIEGCIRIEKLPGGVYSFDKNKFMLTCGKRSFRLGDPVVIKVDDVTADKINFSLWERDFSENE